MLTQKKISFPSGLMATSRVNIPVETTSGANSFGIESGIICPIKGPDRSRKLSVWDDGRGLLQEKTVMASRMLKWIMPGDFIRLDLGYIYIDRCTASLLPYVEQKMRHVF